MADAAIILAAGKGTRMSSDIPKVLNTIGGRPMLAFVVDAVRAADVKDIYIVVGYRADEVRKAMEGEDVTFVLQEEQLGTGHAVMQCEPALDGFDGTVLVLNGDVPGLKPETITSFRDAHLAANTAATVLSAELDNPTGYGRIVKDEQGHLAGIVEEKDADEATRAIQEVNSGLFCFDKAPLFDALASTSSDNAQGEYYLTDVIKLLRERGDRVGAYKVSNADEVSGVNTDTELEQLRGMIEG